MGKSTPKQEVPLYHMSLHFGVCGGPVDKLISVTVDEKEILNTNQADPAVYAINKDDLFGGVKQQGGVKGLLHWLPGKATQALSTFLARKFGRTPNSMSGFRNLASLFFTEFPVSGDLAGGSTFKVIGNAYQGNDGRKGFYWQANNPMVPGVWAKVSRVPRAWYPAKAEIAHVRYGTMSPMAVAFIWDTGYGTSEGTFEQSKVALKAALDQIGTYVANNPGVRFDVRIQNPGSIFFPLLKYGIGRESVDAAKVQELKDWIDAQPRGRAGDVNNAMTEIKAWFDASLNVTFARRVVVYLTKAQGGATNQVAAAAVTAADMLTRDGGSYNTDNNTSVDMYAVIHDYFTIYPWVANAAQIVNVDDPPIPVISVGDQAGVTGAILDCLRPKSLEPDANPVHMIYECLTNTDFGMSAPSSMIDDASFRAAAGALYAEEFGLSMIWTAQSTIESFIQEILDHIQATLFVNPKTGLLTLKLIRADYDPDTLPVLTKDNCHVVNYQRKLLGETINEIVVTWTNPANEEEETVTYQDLANITLQGGVASDSRNYYGVRSSGLAAYLALRDLRSSSAPLASLEIEADRTAWDLVPGGVFKLNYPEHGIVNMVCRIGNVDYGKPSDPIIKLSVMEDVFGLPLAEYVAPAGSQWTDPSEAPRPADYTYLFTSPYYLAVNFVASDLGATGAYPEALTGVFVGQSGADTLEYELLAEETFSTGTTAFDSGTTHDILARGATTVALDAEASTATDMENFGTLTQGVSPEAGSLIFFGSGAESAVEIALVQSVGVSTVTIKRGVLDTIPRAWPIGTSVWVLPSSARFVDQTLRSASETPDYKVLPRTSLGLLPSGSAPTVSVALSDRAHLPLRPANVTVNSVAFGTADCRLLSSIPVAWSNRNRLLEDAAILSWTDASVTPESGQTTVVEILDGLGALITSHTGLTGTSYSVPTTDFGGRSAGFIRVRSVRDGFFSLQAHQVAVLLDSGYGLGYGFNYGGA